MTAAQAETALRQRKRKGKRSLPPADTATPVTSTPKRRVCVHFARGKCTLGDKCGFLHDMNTPRQKIPMLCKYFQNNKCKEGEACKFSHDCSIEPCRFFVVKGWCKEDTKCPFSHGEVTEDRRQEMVERFHSFKRND